MKSEPIAVCVHLQISYLDGSGWSKPDSSPWDELQCSAGSCPRRMRTVDQCAIQRKVKLTSISVTTWTGRTLSSVG